MGVFAVAILLLCLCVVLQMLGVPVTLLGPSVTSDALGASVLEGFSLPPSLPGLALLPESVLVVDVHPTVHGPILASALFHPPLTRILA
jgi:hypothetical protein